MSPDAALAALLEAAAEAGARRALEAVGRDADGALLIPIKSAPVSYRAILAAEKAGDLRVYRKGHASFVRRDELEAWIMGGTTETEPANDAEDPIGELVDFNERRRGSAR